MKSLNHLIFALLLFCLYSGIASAQSSPANGQLLYETYCTQCHDSIVHIRATKKARNLDDIRHFVDRWQTQLELKWSEFDIESVSRYVNDKFYGYKD